MNTSKVMLPIDFHVNQNIYRIITPLGRATFRRQNTSFLTYEGQLKSS